ncbi:hypothetical protein ASO20_00940 [Mycoplasma sp. (ex Biomphalaria glabrata)]|uniref:methionine adenosyltransferase n=1 Tax=Mycoplasma sp. (ex Biomphalaria glabrata) TaxID=1749074 RepID=UPI00073ADD70|nr:methionine adenosyltransferase [Mycoplasma sp. (ex Biomphalaria glabrata)]ALV23235.1 hypothetical protein ASO20_00940 [Mycoplasma sp. (ex Biomphalaria glabrata)]
MYFTSESVSEGHPDKICDLISDAVLDEFLSNDPNAHVGCECFITAKKLIISGEIKSTYKTDVEKLARSVLKNIGYDSNDKYLDYKTFPIEVIINKQSSEIDDVVTNSLDEQDIGAGDQGIMFGFATNRTHNYMPLPITIAHEIVNLASKLRKNGKFVDAYPDMKSQVTIQFYNNQKDAKVDSIVLSFQCAKNIDLPQAKKFIIESIIKPVLECHNMTLPNLDKIYLNPFNIGGPVADTGLTGRKIIVDTYGGWSRHGGGAFSGKDPTKVDRSAAYAARYIAKNLVAAGIADECEIQIGYVIGYSDPVSICVNTFGTSKYSDDQIIKVIREVFNLQPRKIIETLNLRKTKYFNTAAYGHFGQEEHNFSWEQLNKVEEIKRKIIS